MSLGLGARVVGGWEDGGSTQNRFAILLASREGHALSPRGATGASRPLGFEPPYLHQRKKASLCEAFVFFGGDKGARTPDLMTASHALSQLSYIPGMWCANMIAEVWRRANGTRYLHSNALQ